MNQAMEEQAEITAEVEKKVDQARAVAGGVGPSDERDKRPASPQKKDRLSSGQSVDDRASAKSPDRQEPLLPAAPKSPPPIKAKPKEDRFERDQSRGRGGSHSNRGRGSFQKRSTPWPDLRSSITKISDSASNQVDEVKNLTKPETSQNQTHSGRLPVHPSIKEVELRGKNCHHYSSTGSCTNGVICKNRHDYHRCHNQVEDALRFDTIQGMVAVTNKMVEQINQALCNVLKQNKQLTKEVESLRRDLKNIGVTPSGIQVGRSSLKDRSVDYTKSRSRSKSTYR